ncbi:hypothetical protein Tco_0441939 [Tanacetum coccineum]
MKHWEELIRKNVFGLGGHRDHLPACLAYMLYCIVAEEQYNLADLFFKRIESARATPTANLPYDMVMLTLALKQTQKPQSDCRMPKVCHSVSSSSAHHFGSSSHHGDDDKDDGISRISTPSPTSFLNSLSPLNYQRYGIPTSSQHDDDLLFERQIALINQTQQMHEEVRGGFNEHGSMDFTLTLSPITPLDIQFNTPSPPSHPFGHPISWNLLEAHGDSCLCEIKLKAKGCGLAIGEAHGNELSENEEMQKWVELGTAHGRGSLAAGQEASELSSRRPRCTFEFFSILRLWNAGKGISSQRNKRDNGSHDERPCLLAFRFRHAYVDMMKDGALAQQRK